MVLFLYDNDHQNHYYHNEDYENNKKTNDHIFLNMISSANWLIQAGYAQYAHFILSKFVVVVAFF